MANEGQPPMRKLGTVFLPGTDVRLRVGTSHLTVRFGEDHVSRDVLIEPALQGALIDIVEANADKMIRWAELRVTLEQRGVDVAAVIANICGDRTSPRTLSAAVSAEIAEG
jgi:hypothetical protein